MAGVLLALAGLTHALSRRSPRVGARAGAARGARSSWRSRCCFPKAASSPIRLLSFAATALVVLAFLWALPARERLLRVGGARVSAGLRACACRSTRPMGSNIERYGVLLAGPLLAVRARAGSARAAAPLARLQAALALCGDRRVGGVGPGARDAGGRRQRIDPRLLLRAGRALPGRAHRPPAAPVRVEVPLTRSHWEAALLAPTVSLARGWEKQLDTRFDGVLLAPGLTAAGVRALAARAGRERMSRCRTLRLIPRAPRRAA